MTFVVRPALRTKPVSGVLPAGVISVFDQPMENTVLSFYSKNTGSPLDTTDREAIDIETLKEEKEHYHRRRRNHSRAQQFVELDTMLRLCQANQSKR